MGKLIRRDNFYKLCQQVVDYMIENDIHQLGYGKPLGPVKAQHMAGVIEILRQYGALERIGNTDCFNSLPAIYRLFYVREFEMLIDERRKAVIRLWINIILMVIALISAFITGASLFKG